MKIALLTDTHWGARNDHSAFIEHFKQFYEGTFFPVLKERAIDTVIMLGDTFDRRKYTNHTTIQAAREIYFDRLQAEGIDTTIIIGNHDTFYRNTLSTNSVDLLLSEYSNITIIDSPKAIAFDGVDIGLVPWICADNEESCMNFLQSTQSQIIMGHFEVAGFEMYRGHPGQDGLPMNVFERFDLAFSGHYHHRSTKRNITYLGTPYEITWQDYDDQKGFHIFDTDTRTLEFIENPFKMFNKIEYNDRNQEPVIVKSELEKTYVKVVVVHKTDFARFERFIQELHTVGCYDIKIIEDMDNLDGQEIDATIDLSNTLTVLEKYIDTVNSDVNKQQIKDYIKSLYLEAITLEDTPGI